MLEELKESVCEANRALDRHDLVRLTWGNASGIDRAAKCFVIKPSGVPYADLTPASMVVVDLDGRVVDGSCSPSSDTPTHAILYRTFEGIGGICHTHSTHATAFAQACEPIPCYGTTHADTFFGEVPVTRALTQYEIASRYEANTGEVIAERFGLLKSIHVPGVLVAHHGPFTWGTDAGAAVEHAVILEEVARLAILSRRLRPDLGPIPRYLLEKHFQRKHGPDATYGQGE